VRKSVKPNNMLSVIGKKGPETQRKRGRGGKGERKVERLGKKKDFHVKRPSEIKEERRRLPLKKKIFTKTLHGGPIPGGREKKRVRLIVT